MSGVHIMNYVDLSQPLNTVLNFFELDSISTACVTRILSRKKVFVILVCILAAVTTLSLTRLLVSDEHFYNSHNFKYKPSEVIINPGEVAEKVTNISRSIKLNDFSKHKYVVYYSNTSQLDNNSQPVEKTMQKPPTSPANASRKETQEKCKPQLCNKGVCFENMLCYKLPPLDPHFKNPCFYEEVGEDDSDQNVYKNRIIQRMVPDVNIPAVQNFHKNWQTRRNGTKTQLRCLPYFFIIGMEKCGTTDLYQRINMHPQVALSMAKELQWWTRRRFFYIDNGTYPRERQTDEYKLQHISKLVNVPFKHYYAFFDNVADQIVAKTEVYVDGTGYHQTITGDGSPNTMYWNDFSTIFNLTRGDPRQTLVAHHVAATLPQARIIAILRNPVDRLYSSYLFFNRAASKLSFHVLASKGIELFNKCIGRKSLRDCVYEPKLKENIGSTVNIMQGIYSVMLEDWLEVFSPSQVHIVHFETYKKSEIDEINKIFKFLDLGVVSKDEQTGQRIMAKEKVFGGKQYDQAGHMMAQTRTLLNNFYLPFNKKLAKLLNDDRYLWQLQS